MEFTAAMSGARALQRRRAARNRAGQDKFLQPFHSVDMRLTKDVRLRERMTPSADRGVVQPVQQLECSGFHQHQLLGKEHFASASRSESREHRFGILRAGEHGGRFLWFGRTAGFPVCGTIHVLARGSRTSNTRCLFAASRGDIG